jgi:hypothetical protein
MVMISERRLIDAGALDDENRKCPWCQNKVERWKVISLKEYEKAFRCESCALIYWLYAGQLVTLQFWPESRHRGVYYLGPYRNRNDKQ